MPQEVSVDRVVTAFESAPSSLVDRTARALAELSLAAEPGGYLGSEDDLLARFTVSRPTLRQALRMVANDRLVSVRRGTRGGLYADRPDAADSVRAMARYLRLNGATLHDVIAVTSLIAEQTGALAAQCRDDGLRDDLRAFAARIDACRTPGQIVRAENELAGLLTRMTGNPVIEAVMAIGFSFGMDEQRVRFYASEEDREKARELQRGLCRAVLEADAEVARLMMRRRSAVFEQWLQAQPVEREGAGA